MERLTRRAARDNRRRTARNTWLVPPTRMLWLLALIASAALILINEPVGRAAEAELAAWLGRHLTLRTQAIDIDGTPHLTVTRARTWRGTGLHVAQTATFWVGVATFAAAAALTCRRIRPARLATLAGAAIAVIVAAMQLRMILNGMALTDGTVTNSATDVIGALVAATTTAIVVTAAIALCLTRRRTRHRAHARHSLARRQTPPVT